MAYEIDKIKSLQIGVQGENIARSIPIDMTSWVEELEAYGIEGYAFHILFQPYNDPNVYPMVSTYDSETRVLMWKITAEATLTPGVGYAEVRAQEETTGLVKKTRVIPTSVEKSVSGTESDPPEVQEAWVTVVLNARTAAEDAAEDAEDAKEAAETARDAAQAAAGDFQGLTATATGLPAGSTPTVNATHRYGGYYNLAFGIPKGETGDPAPAEQVVPAVNAYLQQVITNPDSPPLDRNLSSSSAAAPADLLGELFEKGYQAKGILPANADLNDYIEIGVYRKYTDAAYPAKNLPKPVAQTDVGILAVIRGNAAGSNTAILQYWMTYSKGIYFRRCSNNAWSEWTRVDQTVRNKPVLCVSAFRKGVYSSSQDYYYAISYDSGVSFYELKGSKGFAGNNIVSSDVCLFEWNDGLVLVCTANPGTGSQDIWDFKAVYTKDFNTYYSVQPDLGFMRKAAEYTNSPYVWGPQIFKKGNDLYIVAAVSTGDTVNGDLYNPDSSNSKTRYEYPFARKVVLSFDGTDGFDIEPDGDLFQLQFENDTESIQDISLFYSSSQEKIYCAYKDRILNTVNIARADDLDEEFTDIETFVGDFAYSEACYFTYIAEVVYLYWCVYGLRTDALRREFVYNVNTSGTDTHVGVVNPYHFDEGVQADMRNPYPIEISEDLFSKLAAKYRLPSSIPTYHRADVQEYKESAILTRMSDVIYNRLGKYVRMPDEYLMPISAKITDNNVERNADMCFSNPSFTVKIGGTGTTDIKTPYGNASVTRSQQGDKKYLINHGEIIKGDSTVSE